MKPKSICSHPDIPEMSRRLERLQAAMQQEGLDYYLCYDPGNIFYLTNFANYVHERPFILLIPASGNMIFLMPSLEKLHVQVRVVGELELLEYREFPAPAGQRWNDRLQEVLGSTGRVGIESQCPISVMQAVPAEVVVTDLVDELRMIKSEYEVGRIAYTCELLNEGHRKFMERATPGLPIIQLYKQISGEMLQQLLQDNINTNLLNTKLNAVAQPPHMSVDPHNFTDIAMQLENGGPHVTIVNGTANGYGAEVERTFFLGEVPENARRPFDDMLEARALAYGLAVPGQCMSELDQRVNEFLRNKGYGDHMLHRTGHSFGVTDHEAPFLAEGYEREIKLGMVFSIEPAIYLEGIGGFRFSDTVLITETGNLKLTDAPETLEGLTLPI
ncbi:TPA: aminopeptidase P family protein [Pseudomonas aeruginosa]|nr:aminopeptidase P family protein [Pseudomonas fluorescens]HBO1995411.1 aminopeptidase P family protein [Pseudomonas aeruginosa]